MRTWRPFLRLGVLHVLNVLPGTGGRADRDASEEVKLFDAPDLAALQRNWPRIALRGAILLLVPFLVTMLARSLDLYGTIASLPLPLDFLNVGPFAYEGKIIFAIVATFLALAFLIPKRTPQLVIGVCVAGVLWTGHIYISLQWARLFASQFNFRRDAAPEPAAWIYATLLLGVGVLFLLVENLLDTRQQQEDRQLSKEETRAAFDVGWRTLGFLLALGAALAAILMGTYLGLRALLANAALPFRLNPVFVLFAMGVVLAVLVATAARKQHPTEWIALSPSSSPASPAPSPTRASAPLLPATNVKAANDGLWARMILLERAGFVLSFAPFVLLFIPWVSFDGGQSLGVATPGAFLIFPAIATLVTYTTRRRKLWSRFGLTAFWAIALLQVGELVQRILAGFADLEIGLVLGPVVALGAAAATFLAGRARAAMAKA